MDASRADGSATVAASRDLLAAALSAAADAWGSFDLTLDRFAPRAVERVARGLGREGLAPPPAVVREWMGRTALADLALAIACSDDVPGAWEVLVAGLSPRLAGLARSRGAPRAEADTLA